MGSGIVRCVGYEAWWEKIPYKCTDSNIKEYNGINKPKCNNGIGCKRCWTIYYAKNDKYGISATLRFYE